MSQSKAGRRPMVILAFLAYPEKTLPPLFVIVTCLKILLIPSYRSTDFDVHRNWLAITRQTDISEWYWNDVNGGTVHTLDYPPAFALFEYILSNNRITDFVLPPGDRCLELLPDTDNDPSEACVIFQRSTVILSDCIFWAGSYFACQAYHQQVPPEVAVTSFLLIVFNPALLWLDHIHFQYNGMIIGVLMASLGCLMMGNNVAIVSTEQTVRQPIAYHLYHLAGAALFALLLNLKHLYLPLAPLFFCYLLERYCLSVGIHPEKKRKEFLPGKFLIMGMVTGSVLVAPWIPFLKGQEYPAWQMIQILRRLFPFSRGLVHDYWAANIWAIYTFANRVFVAVIRRLVPILVMPLSSGLASRLERLHLPEPSPLMCASILLLTIIPGLQMASLRLTNKKLIESVVYVSFCAFMLAYHVHEKAILTTLIPLTLLVEPCHRSDYHNLLFWHIAIWGLLSLFPLLFRPIELTFKVASFLCYMGLTSYLLRTPPRWLDGMEYSTMGIVALVIGLLECVPIQGKWEFFPLMVTSLACAFGLLGCWIMSLWLLIDGDKE
mmetsp:Transcript_18914/g.41113  ORF Transcript_18914/g.41113 Transcript_18914/m.41113 type:complete len:549 (+) Transcript_18914:133-1779(+)